MIFNIIEQVPHQNVNDHNLTWVTLVMVWVANFVPRAVKSTLDKRAER